MKKLIISKTVWILSFVSLFTDAASEMLYPVMPLYLQSIGFSIFLIGILEGVAEATAGLSKGYFGKWSDESGKRLPFVQLGYALSALSRPLIALFTLPLWIFGMRTLDRFGKGLRTGARDAMLSDEATKETKGSIFGLHRAMDTLGAAIGPGLALIYLYLNPGDYIHLFYIAFIPGILAVLSTFLLKDKGSNQKKISKHQPFSAIYSYWTKSNRQYKKVVAGLLAFALFNSSDVFLLLKAKEAGFDDTWLIGIYIFYNLVYALFAFPLGRISDRFGLKNVYVAGLFLFAMVYVILLMDYGLWSLVLAFFLYGIYSAATYGISKAWLSNISPTSETASAIGTYSGFQSICAMIASSLAGFIWMYFGSKFTFGLTAGMTLLVMIYFIYGVSSKNTDEMNNAKISN